MRSQLHFQCYFAARKKRWEAVWGTQALSTNTNRNSGALLLSFITLSSSQNGNASFFFHKKNNLSFVHTFILSPNGMIHDPTQESCQGIFTELIVRLCIRFLLIETVTLLLHTALSNSAIADTHAPSVLLVLRFKQKSLTKQQLFCAGWCACSSCR